MALGPLTNADTPLKVISNTRFNGQKRKIEPNPGMANEVKRNLKFKGLSVTSWRDLEQSSTQGIQTIHDVDASTPGTDMSRLISICILLLMIKLNFLYFLDDLLFMVDHEGDVPVEVNGNIYMIVHLIGTLDSFEFFFFLPFS
jgi:hypothetical protein